jgi:hypothetical protein
MSIKAPQTYPPFVNMQDISSLGRSHWVVVTAARQNAQ